MQVRLFCIPDRSRFDTSAELATDDDIKHTPTDPGNYHLLLCRNELITEQDRFPVYKVCPRP